MVPGTTVTSSGLLAAVLEIFRKVLRIHDAGLLLQSGILLPASRLGLDRCSEKNRS